MFTSVVNSYDTMWHLLQDLSLSCHYNIVAKSRLFSDEDGGWSCGEFTDVLEVNHVPES